MNTLLTVHTFYLVLIIFLDLLLTLSHNILMSMKQNSQPGFVCPMEHVKHLILSVLDYLSGYLKRVSHRCSKTEKCWNKIKSFVNFFRIKMWILSFFFIKLPLKIELLYLLTSSLNLLSKFLANYLCSIVNDLYSILWEFVYYPGTVQSDNNPTDQQFN